MTKPPMAVKAYALLIAARPASPSGVVAAGGMVSVGPMCCRQRS